MESSSANKRQTAVSSGQPDFVRIEHEVLDFWERQQCFQKLLQKLARRPLFRFLDGPITANNPMGVHHAMGRALKDIFLRYKTLKGYDCRFQNGFDCQGLWVEVEVEKDLGFKGKPDIEAYGLDKFSQACRERVNKFSQIQTKQSIRLGQWMDWSDSYYTHTDQNIEGIWGFLQKCHQNGWLYRSGLPMPWCTRCGTSLSEHEMSGSYQTLKHLAVFMKLLVPAINSRILVWTTTPWTLAANTALAVNPQLEYAQLKVEGEDLPLILSADVLRHWESGSLKGKAHQVLRTFPGQELVDLDYEPILSELPAQQGFRHRIVAWDEVDPQEGTGVVHIAPGCGREDFELSQGIELVRLSPADEKGDYLAGYGFLDRKNVHDVAEEVAAYLEAHGKLLSKYMHEHSYPVCWRCKSQLIFRLVHEWYIATKDIRPRLLEAAASVHWQPEHVGKRMTDWLNNMGDWCISRKRFWGLPLPFYPCPACQTLTVAGSRQELQALSSCDLSAVSELHRPWIDQVKIKCPACANPVTRVVEVGDCWLDAGIVPFTTKGCYGRQDGKWQPADWISEMSEQVRLWFYSILFMGVTLSGQAPYKRVLTYERVTAEDGSKFSKTGYMIKFDDAAEQMGVDAMRYYFASQPTTNDLRFGYAQGDEARRQLISLWNVHSFFKTYAEIDKPSLSAANWKHSELSSSDQWLLAALHQFASSATAAYEDYNAAAVIRELEVFTEGLTNWYIRANRRRFWKSGPSQDKTMGYWALFQALRSMTIMAAPVIPFVAEKIWQESVRHFDSNAALSVHLADWPELPQDWANPTILQKVAKVRQVINIAHRLRAESQIKVRQPLNALYVLGPAGFKEACQEMAALLAAELNVKQVLFAERREELLEDYLELDLKQAGPVLKGEIGKATKIVNDLSAAQTRELLPKIKNGQSVQLPGLEREIPAAVFVLKTRPKQHLAAGEEHALTVALDTQISRALEEEGWIREILRQSQVLRKDSGLEVQDRIQISLATTCADLLSALQNYRALIESETLGTLRFEPLSNPLGTCQVEVGPGAVNISILKQA